MTRPCLSRKEGGTIVRCFSSWMEAPRSRVPTALVVASARFATVMQSSADTAKSFPAAREYEGMIVTAWQAPVLHAKATDRLDLFRNRSNRVALSSPISPLDNGDTRSFQQSTPLGMKADIHKRYRHRRNDHEPG